MVERSSPTRRTCERAARTCGRNYARVVASRGEVKVVKTTVPRGHSGAPLPAPLGAPRTTPTCPQSRRQAPAPAPECLQCGPVSHPIGPVSLRTNSGKSAASQQVKIQLLQATCAPKTTRRRKKALGCGHAPSRKRQILYPAPDTGSPAYLRSCPSATVRKCEAKRRQFGPGEERTEDYEKKKEGVRVRTCTEPEAANSLSCA